MLQRYVRASGLFLLIIIIEPTHALDDDPELGIFRDYRCTIDRVSVADGDNGPIYQEAHKYYVGKQFSVERKSGVMSGILKNSFVTRPQVIDMGGVKQNSYKVVQAMKINEGAGYGTNISALNISEFVESPKKPFVFLWNDTVWFGQCEHE